MATTVQTVPGVYVTELPAFPPSVVGVQTAIPIFIGYTEYAIDPVSQKPVYMQAIALTSMADYYNAFGHGYDSRYGVTDGTADKFDFEAWYSADGIAPPTLKFYNVANNDLAGGVPVRFNLYTALKLFYANGGGNCYVVSVANYWGTQTTTPPTPPNPVAIDAPTLVLGLAPARDQVGPTMLVIPDACLLDKAGYTSVVTEQMKQAGQLQDRVAILDLQGAMDPASWTTAGLDAQRGHFYEDIGASAPYFSYGAAYAPALRTTAVTLSEIDFTNLQATQLDSDRLKTLLTTQNGIMYTDATKNAEVQKQIDAAFPIDIAKPTITDQATITSTNNYLTNALPLLLQTENILLGMLNVAPPSGVMAGVWTFNDLTRGVWNAPANMTCASVTAPVVLLTDANQGEYNVPLNGNAIDILRSFVNRGTVVWGARTLDGNSNDYRYIQVRRTLVYIEQSIKTALQPFVFAANDGKTWVTVTGMISNFLTQLWTQGGLMGDKASDAFTVQCGLGSTMTGQDILNGYMVVAVTLQMIRPAEFIELTFTQTMQGVNG